MSRLLPLLVILSACNRDVEDTVEEVVVPLDVSIDSVATGDFVASADLTVSGTAAGTGATFHFNASDLAPSEGVYSELISHDSALWPTSPLWPLTVHGQDDSAWLRQRVTAIHGQAITAADPINNALILRITDHLLDTLEPVIAAEIENVDIAGSITPGQPVSSTGAGDVYVDDFSVDSIEITNLDFTEQGLAWGAKITNISVDVRGEIIFLGTQEGTISAEEIDVTGFLILGGAQDGSISVTPQNTGVQFTALSIEGFDNPLFDGLINSFLSDFIAAEFESQIVEALEDVLKELDAIRHLDLGGITLENDFTTASHDANGVNVYARSTLYNGAYPLEGSRLSNPNTQANPTTVAFEGTNYGAAILFDDDVISALGVGLYQGGLLEQTIDSEASPIALTTTTLAGFVEAFEQLPPGKDITIVTKPTLGFPASPAPASPEALRLHVGGMGLEFQVDTDDDGTPEPQMTVVVDIVVALQGGENVIDFELVDIAATMTETTLDVADPSVTEESLAGMFGILLPGILSDALTGGFGTDGALSGLESVGSAPEGSAGDYGAMYFNIDPDLLLPEEETPAP